MRRVAFYIIVNLFLLVPFARAQPELKVGQVVELRLKNGEVCSGYFWFFGGGRNPNIKRWVLGSVPNPKNTDLPSAVCQFTAGSVESYRILKPAPRSEFKLPSEKDIRCGNEEKEQQFMWIEGTKIPFRCFAPNDQAIADELRYLRKEIEALKK